MDILERIEVYLIELQNGKADTRSDRQADKRTHKHFSIMLRPIKKYHESGIYKNLKNVKLKQMN